MDTIVLRSVVHSARADASVNCLLTVDIQSGMEALVSMRLLLTATWRLFLSCQNRDYLSRLFDTIYLTDSTAILFIRGEVALDWRYAKYAP
jgi:hypothetical protein